MSPDKGSLDVQSRGYHHSGKGWNSCERRSKPLVYTERTLSVLEGLDESKVLWSWYVRVVVESF